MFAAVHPLGDLRRQRERQLVGQQANRGRVPPGPSQGVDLAGVVQIQAIERVIVTPQRLEAEPLEKLTQLP